MNTQCFPQTCHQPVTQKLDELLRVTTRLETELQSVNSRLTKIENKFDKATDDINKNKTTVSHLVSFANKNKNIKEDVDEINHQIESLYLSEADRKGKISKIIENVYQVCFIILTVVLPIIFAKMGFAQ